MFEKEKKENKELRNEIDFKKNINQLNKIVTDCNIKIEELSQHTYDYMDELCQKRKK